MLFIYLLEQNPVHTSKVLKIHQGMVQRQDTLCTSVFTVGEVLTGPRKTNDERAIKGIREFFLSGQIEVIPFDLTIAERYSSIRATFRVSQADAIHVATAAVAGVDLFITNDTKLRKLTIPSIKFMADLEGRVYPAPNLD